MAYADPNPHPHPHPNPNPDAGELAPAEMAYADGEPPSEDDPPEVTAARELLERQFRGEAGAVAVEAAPVDAKPEPEPEEVLAQVMGWFETHFGRVLRVMGTRQRRVVETSTEAERVYATFWAEAARLAGDARDDIGAGSSAGSGGGAGGGRGASGGRDALLFADPADAASSLIVLPGLDEAEAFRQVLRSLTLSLALLGLAGDLSISAFHPADTFMLVDAEDGTRSWEMQLAHPLIHLVRKK